MEDRAQTLKALFQAFTSKYPQKKFVIGTHSRADVDGISSAFALIKLFPGSVIVSDEDPSDGGKLLVEKLGITIQPWATLSPKDFDGLIMVDNSAYTLAQPARNWNILCVIDHHRPEGKDMKAEFEILDPDSPSCAELVSNLVPEEIVRNPSVAFALAVGIIADGARFKSARAETFVALGRIMGFAKIPYPELLSYAEPEPKTEAKLAIVRTLKRLEFVYVCDYLVVTSEATSNESDTASLLTDAADVAFIAKWKDETKETRISARARRDVKVPLNEVLARVGKELGGAGGGHAKAAGASLPGKHTDEALKLCIDVFMDVAEKYKNTQSQ